MLNDRSQAQKDKFCGVLLTCSASRRQDAGRSVSGTGGRRVPGGLTVDWTEFLFGTMTKTCKRAVVTVINATELHICHCEEYF